MATDDVDPAEIAAEGEQVLRRLMVHVTKLAVHVQQLQAVVVDEGRDDGG